MKDGAVIEASSVEEVLTRPREAYTRELLEGAGQQGDYGHPLALS